VAYVGDLICASVAAQLATLPLVVASFGGQPLLSVPFNLICVPLCMAGYVLGLLALLVSVIFMPLAAMLARVPDALLAALTAITRAGGGIEGGYARIGRYPFILIVAHWSVMLAASDLSRIRLNVRRLMPLGLVGVAALSTLLVFMKAWPLTLVFLDAGQADCAVVQNHGCTWLIDAGDTYTPAADYLSANCLKLNGIVLSHPHEDHAGGLLDILDSFRPDAIYVPAGWFDLDVPPEEWRPAFWIDEANPDLKLCTRAGAESYYMGFNYANPIMEDLNVRKALMQAIDKDAIEMIALEGGIAGKQHYNFCTPNGLGYDASVAVAGYDLEAAKAVLEPLDLKLTLVHYAGVCAKTAEVIQECWKQAGVELTLRLVADGWTEFKAAQEGYDVFLDYCAYQGALMHNFHRFFADGGSSNVYGYSSAEYMELDNKVATAPTYEDQLKEFSVLQHWVAENLPNVPLFGNTILAAARADVEGLYFAPTANYHNFSTVRCPARG